jgi:hypothetical protein
VVSLIGSEAPLRRRWTRLNYSPCVMPKTMRLRHLADLIALMLGQPLTYENTLPTFTDGVRVQEVLEASLASQEQWADVSYAYSEDPSRRD